jgi:acetyl-CoA carboxylase carboxyl transferase subunit alpha
MSRLSVPVICTVIGEGGSGGALAIGVGDKVNMLQYSTYSLFPGRLCVHSVEERGQSAAGCRSDGHHCSASERAADRSIIPEPLGGAPQPGSDGGFLKAQLLADLADLDAEKTLNRRY